MQSDFLFVKLVYQLKKKNESIPKRVSSPSSSTGIKPKGYMCNSRKVSLLRKEKIH